MLERKKRINYMVKSFEKLESFMEKHDLLRKFDYHTEIYLSNKNRTSEKNLKTILRYSVK